MMTRSLFAVLMVPMRASMFTHALAVIVLTLLTMHAPALAQGTMGALPDPITSRELDEYARRLGLSGQQRIALEGYHEAYKTQFTALREGEIERYLSGNPIAGSGGRGGDQGGRGRGGMGGRGMGMGMLMGSADRKDIENSLRDLKSINERIRLLDNALFDEVQTVLTEEQSLMLNSVRLARERDRYRTGLGRMTMFTNPSTQVDMTDLVTGMALSPQESEAVTPLLTAYESTLTSSVKRLHDDANQSTIALMEKMEKLGFTAETMQDRERRGAMFEAFRTVWGEVMTQLNERATAISELNRRTERSLNATLTPDNGRRLRESFYRRAYPEIRGSSNTGRAFEMALELDSLADDQRAAIVELQTQYQAQLDRVYEQMADAIDDQRKNRNPMEFGDGRGGRGRGDTDDEQLDKLREQRQQLMDTMRAQLETSLLPEQLEAIQQRVAENRERGRGGDRGERGERAAAFIAVAPGVAGGAPGQIITTRIEGLEIEGLELELARDPFVPQAISDRDLQVYATRLQLDDEAKAILTGLHAEYLDRFEQINSTEIQAVRDADEGLWQRGNGGRPTPPEPEAVDRVYSLRRAAIASIKSLDEQFFNDLQLVLLSEEQLPLLERVRNSRLRSIYNRGSGQAFRVGRGGGGGGGAPRAIIAGQGSSGESGVDLSSLVEQSNLPRANVLALDAELAEYETAATAAFQIMFESSIRMRQASDRMAGRFMRRDRGDQGSVNINADEIRRTMENEGRATREAASAITNLNRQTLERLVAGLESTAATALKSAYNRRAFPDVYRDWRSAETRLEAALTLPDLSDDQRQAVQAMTFEFRAAYESLCEQMIELEQAAPLATGGMPDADAMSAMQERLRNREKLEFERNDLSDKMLARLRSMLSEDQVQRLGLDRGDRRSS